MAANGPIAARFRPRRRPASSAFASGTRLSSRGHSSRQGSPPLSTTCVRICKGRRLASSCSRPTTSWCVSAGSPSVAPSPTSGRGRRGDPGAGAVPRPVARYDRVHARGGRGVRADHRRSESASFRRRLRRSDAIRGADRAGRDRDRDVAAFVAMDLAGPGSVFLKQAWTFLNPARIGDTLTATGTV